MKFSYNWLREYIGGKLPAPEKLAELLTLRSFEVKTVQQAGKDFILDIEVSPNRIADCGGHFGIARECCAILGAQLKIPPIKLREDAKIKTQDFVSVEVQDANACRRYTARAVIQIKVCSSPQWLREKLEVCGIQSINNVVDAANYVMLETGQPLHAFDADKIRDRKIIVRYAGSGEKMTALDQKDYELADDILVIADSQNPMAIAGIKGGKNAGVDKKTKTIIFESANFAPAVVRRASRKINLRTDASLRFEHDLDPGMTEFAVSRAVELAQAISGGRIAGGLIDIYPKKSHAKKVKLEIENYLKCLLGIDIPLNEVERILTALGFKISKYTVPLSAPDSRKKKIKSRCLIVEVPSWRRDILIPADLAEEIGRIYGLEKIPADPPVMPFTLPAINDRILWRNFARDALQGMGFTEIYTYSFLNENDVKTLSSDSGKIKKDFYKILNPTSGELAYLRPNLLSNLLKKTRENAKLPDLQKIRIFEAGRVFAKDKGEREMLSGIIFRRAGGDEGFYELKGFIESLLEQMGIAGVWYDDTSPSPEDSSPSFWALKKCAEIQLDQEEIGFLGLISRGVLDFYGITGSVFAFEIDFEKILRLASAEHEYRPLSSYPAAVRDIALLVPKETRVADVLNIIAAAGREMVRDVDLFDLYEGEEIPAGKKNFAFHIIYQAGDHTLSQGEIETIHQQIVSLLEKNPEWEVRK